MLCGVELRLDGVEKPIRNYLTDKNFKIKEF